MNNLNGRNELLYELNKIFALTENNNNIIIIKNTILNKRSSDKRMNNNIQYKNLVGYIIFIFRLGK